MFSTTTKDPKVPIDIESFHCKLAQEYLHQILIANLKDEAHLQRLVFCFSLSHNPIKKGNICSIHKDRVIKQTVNLQATVFA